MEGDRDGHFQQCRSGPAGSYATGARRALHALARSRPANTVRIRGGELLVTGILRDLLASRTDVQFSPARLVALEAVSSTSSIPSGGRAHPCHI